MAIEFVEKECKWDSSPYTGDCWYYPTFMIKDGKEYFLFNRRDPDDSYSLEQQEGRKKQLLENNGAYYTGHSFFRDPLDYLKYMVNKKRNFSDPYNLYYGSFDRTGSLDFHGNLQEVSAAFFYRIFDQELATKIQKAVRAISAHQWEKADRILNDAE